MYRLNCARHPMRGMSPVELIVVVAVVLILLLLLVPVFWDVSVNVKRDSVINSINSSIMLARSEALRRNSSVTLCPSGDGASCLPGSRPEWNGGWIIFVDLDEDRVRGDGEELLRVFEFEHPSHTMTGSAGLQKGVLFRSDGYPDTDGQLDYCETEGSLLQHSTIKLNLVGRLEVISADGACPQAGAEN